MTYKGGEIMNSLSFDYIPSIRTWRVRANADNILGSVRLNENESGVPVFIPSGDWPLMTSDELKEIASFLEGLVR